jgi:serine/threonine protein kinase
VISTTPQDAIDTGALLTEPHRLQGRPYLPAILATAAEVAAGMAALHRQDMVHGDLSGFNVMLSSSGEQGEVEVEGQHAGQQQGTKQQQGDSQAQGSAKAKAASAAADCSTCPVPGQRAGQQAQQQQQGLHVPSHHHHQQGTSSSPDQATGTDSWPLPDDRGFAARVADFGFSRRLNHTSLLHASSYGTITHMPPELLARGLLGKAADVYSFGVLLWQMWTCSRPWAGLRHHQVYEVGGWSLAVGLRSWSLCRRLLCCDVLSVVLAVAPICVVLPSMLALLCAALATCPTAYAVTL